MKVLVTGGRDYNNYEKVNEVLNSLDIASVCQGGAYGADHWAWKWCFAHNIPCKEYKADWSLGKKAGPLRNQHMLEDFKPDLVIAFPGGRGTADMVSRARAAGVEVLEVKHEEST